MKVQNLQNPELFKIKLESLKILNSGIILKTLTHVNPHKCDLTLDCLGMNMFWVLKKNHIIEAVILSTDKNEQVF